MPTRLVHTSIFFLALATSCAGARESAKDAPIHVGGWGDWTYVYEPSYLPLPKEADVEQAHGIAIDDKNTVIITYKDHTDQSKCLLRWKEGEYEKIPEFLGPGESLCAGTPHGLRAQVENGTTVLYHANNQQLIHKTTLDGDIIWSVQGSPDNTSQDDNYSPTWFAAQDDSPYVYLADGYGSSKVYVYNRTDGNYTGHSFGGHGSDHGQFQTDHAITYDSRIGRNQMVVCDRENHRLEYFRIDPTDPSVFEYTHTVSFDPLLRRPCNIRMRPEDGVAIIPFLEGTVGILTENNELMSVVNITEMLGDKGFLHPHDAHFVPGLSGDFVLVTWNPGRIGYFRRVHASEVA